MTEAQTFCASLRPSADADAAELRDAGSVNSEPRRLPSRGIADELAVYENP